MGIKRDNENISKSMRLSVRLSPQTNASIHITISEWNFSDSSSIFTSPGRINKMIYMMKFITSQPSLPNAMKDCRLYKANASRELREIVWIFLNQNSNSKLNFYLLVYFVGNRSKVNNQARNRTDHHEEIRRKNNKCEILGRVWRRPWKFSKSKRKPNLSFQFLEFYKAVVNRTSLTVFQSKTSQWHKLGEDGRLWYIERWNKTHP